MNTIRCYLQVNAGKWCQEHYCTKSRHAARRARQLRHAGFDVSCVRVGPQVTRYGRVDMTLVSIYPRDPKDTTDDLPTKLWELVRA